MKRSNFFNQLSLLLKLSSQDSINAFNQKMFKAVSDIEDGNIFYSPFSLHMLLSQAYAGAPTRFQFYKLI